ncbi:c-type cytochrome [Paenibacillus eucommiae]|uniref:Cytochrome c551 n=1 Tax=Paenibacillus eucommiae TaxID=1355755 RepID=A0ABS4IXW7_9BACL|nr:cytochrome c [Paenibacillus eucommiae]MBP1992417.1 cytochrome c551 [Paenibacillus eucommiae]
MKKIAFPMLLIILLISGISACSKSGGNEVTPVPSPAASGETTVDTTAKATELYKNFCITCHGSSLPRMEAPDLQKVGERLSAEQIVKQIEKGGNGMPGFRVSMKDEEIQILANWLADQK